MFKCGTCWLKGKDGTYQEGKKCLELKKVLLALARQSENSLMALDSASAPGEYATVPLPIEPAL